MTDRPIILNADQVRAALDGRKTQDRRVLKLKKYRGFFQFGRSDTPGYDWTFRRKDHVWEDFRHHELLRLIPIQIGDRLWVCEQFGISGITWGQKPSQAKGGRVHHLADADHGWKTSWGKTHPSTQMPRWASRLTLSVTDVQVQRLQEISEADAIDEGAPLKDGWDGLCCGNFNELISPTEWFRRTWSSTHGPDAWDANPWVCATTFTTHHCNIDQIEAA